MPLAEAHLRMLEHFGPLHWWPGESAFEVVVGAVLTQNTAWTRVTEAIDNLRTADRLDARRLALLPLPELEELIRPAGTFRVKARYLKNVLDWLVGGYDGDVAAALAGDTMARRAELLAIVGVGRETADSILCYAGNHPILVVDAYTRRILSRHGLIGGREDYDAIREWCEARLPRDPAVLNEFHAQVVNVGKDHCRSRRPRCSGCPLFYLFGETGFPEPFPQGGGNPSDPPAGNPDT
jgi:endonuclease-3 related protein